jgi:hypothetical protein
MVQGFKHKKRKGDRESGRKVTKSNGRVSKSKVVGEGTDILFWGEKELQFVISRMFPSFDHSSFWQVLK